MAPEYLDKDIVIVSNILPPTINDVVVVRSFDHGNILKRVVSKDQNVFAFDLKTKMIDELIASIDWN